MSAGRWAEPPLLAARRVAQVWRDSPPAGGPRSLIVELDDAIGRVLQLVEGSPAGDFLGVQVLDALFGREVQVVVSTVAEPEQPEPVDLGAVADRFVEVQRLDRAAPSLIERIDTVVVVDEPEPPAAQPWPEPLAISASWEVFSACDRCSAPAGRTCVDPRNPRYPVMNPHNGRRKVGPRAGRYGVSR